MKKSIFSVVILVLFGFLFGSCGDLFEGMDDDITFPEERDSRFVQCYYEDNLAHNKCDSVLISIFGESLFQKNIEIDLAESTMNCDVDSVLTLLPFGDSNHCLPNSYDLLYSINEKGKSIYSFRMVAGKDMIFEPVSTIVEDQLKGYHKLLSDQFEIDFTKAKKIATANGLNFEESSLELVIGKNSSYHWEAELEYDHNSIVLLLIDAITGETSNEILMIDSIE